MLQGHIIRDHNLSFHIYADDTQIYIAFKPSDSFAAIQQLELCIGKIRSWMTNNKLKLNDDKSEFIMISSPHNKKTLESPEIRIGNEILPTSDSVRNLGVMMDSIFNMEEHITFVCRSCFFHLRNIGSIRKYLTGDIASKVIHAFITSRLDYCNSLLYGLPDKLIFRLKKVQYTAVRIITLCNPNDHITRHLKALHWLPVRLRIKFKLLLVTYKIMNGLAPSYLSELLLPCELHRELRSSCMGNLEIPRTRTVTYGDRAFSAVAPRLWNELPLEIRNAQTVTIFKTDLKTHLFQQF